MDEIRQVGELGRDKLRYRWSVELHLMPSIKEFPITLVKLYVFTPSKLSDPERHPVGRGYLSIKDNERTVAKIEDIVINRPYENRGLGSLLLVFIENWAKKFGVKELFGELSQVDLDHIDKLKHFYEKHGFVFPASLSQKKEKSMFVGRVEKIL